MLTAWATPGASARYPVPGERPAFKQRSRPPILLLRCRIHRTHPEGWRDWPIETPATTVTSQREGANSREMCGGLLALRHTGDTAKTIEGSPTSMAVSH